MQFSRLTNKPRKFIQRAKIGSRAAVWTALSAGALDDRTAEGGGQWRRKLAYLWSRLHVSRRDRMGARPRAGRPPAGSPLDLRARRRLHVRHRRARPLRALCCAHTRATCLQ